MVLRNTRCCQRSRGSAFFAGLNPSGSLARGVKLLFLHILHSLISCVSLVGWGLHCHLVLVSSWALDLFSEGRVLEGILNIAVMPKPFVLTLSEITPKRIQNYLTGVGKRRSKQNMPTLFPALLINCFTPQLFYVLAGFFIGCGACVIHILICQSILLFIRENRVNLGSTPCTVFYKDILHSFYPKSIYFNVWVSAPGNRWTLWWFASCSRSVSLPFSPASQHLQSRGAIAANCLAAAWQQRWERRTVPQSCLIDLWAVWTWLAKKEYLNLKAAGLIFHFKSE